MVSVGRIVSLGLLIAALGLAFGASSQELKAGNPPEHRAKASVKADQNPDGAQKNTEAPLAPEQPAGEARPGETAAEDRGDKHEREGPTWTDQAQALSAVVVMVFTAFLAWLSWRQHVLETDLASDAEQQRADVKESIAESARAASAMEQVATAMAESAVAARDSASYTKELALAADVSARGGVRATRVIEQNSRDQLRAYVHIEKVKVNWQSVGASLVLTAVNSGATPATFIEVSGKIDFQLIDANPRVPKHRKGKRWASLGARDSSTLPLYDKVVLERNLSPLHENYLSARGVVR